MPEHEAESLSTVKEYTADFATRHLLVDPVMNFIQVVAPRLYQSIAFYAVKQRTTMEFAIASFNTLVEFITNKIPFVRRNKTFRAIKNEALGQLPRAFTAYFNERKEQFEFAADFQPLFKPEVTRTELIKVFSGELKGKLGQLGHSFVDALKKYPSALLDRLFPSEKITSPARNRHFAALLQLKPSEREAWVRWVQRLSARGMEVLQGMYEPLGDPEFIRLILAQPSRRRLGFLAAYAKEGPIEDIAQGIGAAVDPLLGRMSTALDRRIRFLR